MTKGLPLKQEAHDFSRGRFTKLNKDFLAFLQEQMECRRSNENGKIGKDERCTTEYLILSMVWEKYLNLHGIWYSKICSGDRAKEVWQEVEAYRKKKSTVN